MIEHTKYQMLLRILDTIRGEARGTKWETQYAYNSHDVDDIQQARAKAFIHLYLKVMFGLSEFADRESFITDGPNDGGIDGYFIDTDSHRIYLIQSKFRHSAKNFETKEIEASELLVMDVDRVTAGKTDDERGTSYNGKIIGLIRRISQISDIARYNYHVAILANCSITPHRLKKLTDGHLPSVFNFERSYNELVFPIISGTHYRAHDVTIQIDLSNKSAGAKQAPLCIPPNDPAPLTHTQKHTLSPLPQAHPHTVAPAATNHATCPHPPPIPLATRRRFSYADSDRASLKMTWPRREVRA